MAKSAYTQKNKKSFSKIIAAIFFPLIFLITLLLIVLTLSGVNVFEEAEKYASRIPGLSTPASSEGQNSEASEMDRLQAVIANKEAEMEELQSEADSKQNQINELEQQVVQLRADLEEARSEDGNNENSKAAEMAQSFQVMDPEEAAPILENMNQNLAVQVLNDVASEERGEILGQMDPEAAANIASMLIEE
ncbi:MotE family protein [Halobacillus sp. SY10]|uniref:Flagellar motility protein MotE, a chaperone for MotC folding n=3 Tax=Halobacillus TaxID=45667 RepID=A0A1H0MV92_HALAD|nr:hypothetical protein [Halobacillus aidingensis]SDO84301.1 Flagellar motility protein MotE, a chaperone for MotC folding [Halobacillus aidingensis]